MRKQNRLPVLLTAVGALWVIRKASRGFVAAQVTEEVMDYRNAMYDIGPNCEITLKSGGESGEDASEDLALLWSEFALPIVHDTWDGGKYTLEDTTTALMEKLFPEEQCVWPPVEESPQSQKMAYYLMMSFMAHQLGCGFEGAQALSEDETCLTESVTVEIATALTTSGIVLGLMAKDLAGTKYLQEQDGAYSISYRAPKAAQADG